MEPAHDERDDRLHARQARPCLVPPQWSPLVMSGMTRERKPQVIEECTPQWSLLVMSGMTARKIRAW
jgi:hypothetical protein